MTFTALSAQAVSGNLSSFTFTSATIGKIFFSAEAGFLVYFFLRGAMGEEPGWRGYALDPLQSRFNTLPASLILGAIWALWHLPLFFIEGATQQAIPMYQFILQTMVLAIFYTWLHNNTSGSVLIAALLHASANMAAAAVPFWTTELGRRLDFGILIMMAGIIIWHWGWRRLSGDGEVRTAVSNP